MACLKFALKYAIEIVPINKERLILYRTHQPLFCDDDDDDDDTNILWENVKNIKKNR